MSAFSSSLSVHVCALQRTADQGAGGDPVAEAFQPRLGRMLAKAYETGGKTEQVRLRVLACVYMWLWLEGMACPVLGICVKLEPCGSSRELKGNWAS
jgi:hypothetical protein